MKKAQGLPVNFIVLIALAVLVLVLAALFFYGGFGSGSASINSQTAANRCNSLCLLDAQRARGMNETDANAESDWNFCAETIDVSEIGTVNCDQVTTCKVTLENGDPYTITC